MSPVLSGNSLEFKTHVFSIEDSSQIGVARRFAANLAENCDFEENQKGRLGIVVNELCTNLLNHAGRGELLFRQVRTADSSRIEVLSIDRGPGMRNVSECMVDGFSTTSTPGNGLGAIVRQSHYFDIYSALDQGTVIFCILENRTAAKVSLESEMQFGVISVPYRGEEHCGDGWAYFLSPEKLHIMVVDGLGHGLLAHEASAQAIQIFKERHSIPLQTQMEFIHQGLRSTRGAAVSIGNLDFTAQKLDFIGVGNVRCVILEQAKMKTMVSQSGTAGLQVRQAKVFSNTWDNKNLLIFHSDGLTTRWDLNNHSGLAMRHPSIIAAVLYRDYNRNTDDVTVFVGGFV